MKYFIGIDEVGRGSIAGPILFCAFVTKNKYHNINQAMDHKYYLNNRSYQDSKKLTDKKRRAYFKNIKNSKNNNNYFLIYNSARDIDKYGLSYIIKKSLESLITKTIKYYTKQDISIKDKRFYIILDGGLKLKEDFIKKVIKKYNINLEWQVIIKGDENNINIRNASIIAKVTRDDYMKRLNKKIIKESQVDYGLDKHAGYGTEYHYKMIKQHKATIYHRKTWIK